MFKLVPIIKYEAYQSAKNLILFFLGRLNNKKSSFHIFQPFTTLYAKWLTVKSGIAIWPEFFVFYGTHRAVLITYPKYSELEQLFNDD